MDKKKRPVSFFFSVQGHFTKGRNDWHKNTMAPGGGAKEELLGIEPRLPESKSGVLPLDYSSFTAWGCFYKDLIYTNENKELTRPGLIFINKQNNQIKYISLKIVKCTNIIQKHILENKQVK